MLQQGVIPRGLTGVLTIGGLVGVWELSWLSQFSGKSFVRIWCRANNPVPGQGQEGGGMCLKSTNSIRFNRNWTWLNLCSLVFENLSGLLSSPGSLYDWKNSNIPLLLRLSNWIWSPNLPHLAAQHYHDQNKDLITMTRYDKPSVHFLPSFQFCS